MWWHLIALSLSNKYKNKHNLNQKSIAFGFFGIIPTYQCKFFYVCKLNKYGLSHRIRSLEQFYSNHYNNSTKETETNKCTIDLYWGRILFIIHLNYDQFCVITSIDKSSTEFFLLYFFGAPENQKPFETSGEDILRSFIAAKTFSWRNTAKPATIFFEGIILSWSSVRRHRNLSNGANVKISFIDWKKNRKSIVSVIRITLTNINVVQTVQ